MAVTKVLLGFAESLAAIESAWSLLEDGVEVVTFAREGRTPALGASRAVRVVAVPAPERDLAGCLAALRRLLARERFDAILPLDDTSVLLCDQLAFPTGLGQPTVDGTVIAGPTGAQARLALDKAEQLEHAEKAGFPVPATAGSDGGGPWMVKSALAVVERDGRIVRPSGAIARNKAEVSRITTEIAAPVLVQPVLDGIGEGVFGIAIDGQVMALSAHRRVRMMNPRGSGSSACQSIPVDPDLARATSSFVDSTGWRGIFMIELLRDTAGRPWFMELNGRAWGSMALARRRGLEYPAWAVRAALDPAWRPAVPAGSPHLLARHAGRELVHLLAVLRGGRGADAGRWPSRGATVAALLRARQGTTWYNNRRGDRRVFLRDTWDTVADQVWRRR